MCFYHDGDGPDFFRQSEHTARKRRRCCECRKSIHPGERYLLSSGKWDDGFDTFTQCLRCVRLIEAIIAVEHDEGCRGDESAPGFGGLFSDVEDWGHYANEFLRRGWTDAYLLVPAPDRDELLELLAYSSRGGPGEYPMAICDAMDDPAEWFDLGGEA